MLTDKLINKELSVLEFICRFLLLLPVRTMSSLTVVPPLCPQPPLLPPLLPPPLLPRPTQPQAQP